MKRLCVIVAILLFSCTAINRGDMNLSGTHRRGVDSVYRLHDSTTVVIYNGDTIYIQRTRSELKVNHQARRRYTVTEILVLLLAALIAGYLSNRL